MLTAGKRGLRQRRRLPRYAENPGAGCLRSGSAGTPNAGTHACTMTSVSSAPGKIRSCLATECPPHDRLAPAGAAGEPPSGEHGWSVVTGVIGATRLSRPPLKPPDHPGVVPSRPSRARRARARCRPGCRARKP